MAALLGSALGAGPAVAAPVLQVDVTHNPSVVPTTDEQVNFIATVGNDALPETAVGTDLVCDPKRWGPPPVSGVVPELTYEWRRNGVVLPGVTASTYKTTAADAGKAIQCLVTGTNINAAAKAAALPAHVVDPQPAIAPPAPATVAGGGSRPTISGTGSATRTCSPPANWTAGTSYTFQWLRNGEEIAGATTDTYTPDAGPGGADVDKVLQCEVVGTNAGGAVVGISNPSTVGSVPNAPGTFLGDTPAVVQNGTSGTVTLTFTLPVGMNVFALTNPGSDNPAVPLGWSCSVVQPSNVTCTRSDVLGGQTSYPGVKVIAAIHGAPSDPATVIATASGGGAASTAVGLDNVSFTPGLPFGITPNTFLARALDSAGDDYTQAGGHPTSGVASFAVNTHKDADGEVAPTGHIRSATTELPAGFVGNPEAVPELCPAVNQILADAFASPSCPRGSIVGGVTAVAPGFGTFERAPLYAVPPERGAPAQFMFGFPKVQALYTLTPRLRPEDGYAIKVDAPAISKSPILGKIDVTLCGYGANVAAHGQGPGFIGIETGFVSCKLPTDADANPQPLLTNPPACGSEPPVTRLLVDSWENPGDFKTSEYVSPALTGCDQVEFTPSVSMTLSSSVRDSASGLDAEISVPDAGLLDPDGVSQAHLRKTVVTLPEGVSVNPSAATGLAGCSDAQIGFGTDDPVSCPDGSRIGSVEVTTPVLEERLVGDMILRTPRSTDPESGQMLRLAIVVESRERGILVKLAGTTTADAQTGRLEATFDQNPQLPFSNLKVRLKAGGKGVLATPQDCGQRATSSVLTPWGQPPAVSSQTAFGVGGDCSLGFAPRLAAGMDNPRGRGHGAFSFRFSREDGQQWMSGLTATLPTGLLASVRGVPLCSAADAAAGACPAGSRIGTVDATAGSGDPFVLERKGDAYLTEGYKGCPYGLAVRVPVVAGPFDASSPATDLGQIVVRQSVCVDRRTAQVTATSDPFPTVWHGIPLRVRSVTVKVDRPDFMLNPSDCEAKQVQATIRSARGAHAGVADHFQVSDCADLRFRPRLGLALKGRRQVRTGRHPAIRAVVRQQGIGEAGIAKAKVTLPKSLALDPDNAQALCEFDDGTKPDLENHCPKGSIVGRARAKTPLLNDDLVGNVYFVKNVRIDKQTGNEIRTLPMIVVALRGEIAVNLIGESSTTKSGKLVNTFDEVPDAPIARFNLNIRGGKNGILAVTRTRRARINLCNTPRRHIAEADIDGHNGRRHDRNIRMRTPCRKRRQSAAKVCRKRTDTKPALRRCVRRVKTNRAQAKRRAAKRKAAAKRRAARR